MSSAIRFEKLVVDYRASGRREKANRALNGLTLTVQTGETFGFLGPNGAGKTTAMNVLLGFMAASSGEAFLFDSNVKNPVARQRIGYLPEMTYYYKFLTGEELLHFYGRIFHIPRPERGRRIAEILKLVGLANDGRRQIATYSKGMQQRIGLAQALINDPDLLILDEPTSGLDPMGRMQIRGIIRRLKEAGKTVFFSSHELGEVETICDRVAILNHGEMKIEGSIKELTRGRENLESVFLDVVGGREEAP